MAFIITAENGASILLIGTNFRESISAFLSGLFVHSVVWLIWATSVKFMGEDNYRSLEDLRGMWHKHPVVCAALLLSHFTLSGMPLLAGFRLRVSLFTACFSVSTLLGWTACFAAGILIFSGLRLLLIFLSPAAEHENIVEIQDEQTRYTLIMRRGLLGALMILLLVISFFPDIMDIFISGIRTQYSLIFG